MKGWTSFFSCLLQGDLEDTHADETWASARGFQARPLRRRWTLQEAQLEDGDTLCAVAGCASLCAPAPEKTVSGGGGGSTCAPLKEPGVVRGGEVMDT